MGWVRVLPMLVGVGCGDLLELPTYVIGESGAGLPTGGGGEGGLGAGGISAGGEGGAGAGIVVGGASVGGANVGGAGGGGSCETAVTYGDRMIPPNGAGPGPGSTEVFGELVTWDGACIYDGLESVALLSNGLEVSFEGSVCSIALDARGDCAAAAEPCRTRVTYGPSWVPPTEPPESVQDFDGAVFSSGSCISHGSDVGIELSNGLPAEFVGAACELSFRWSQCGGLYQNPVFPADCPDPSVFASSGEYYLVCTKDDGVGTFPIHLSKDLVHFEPAGHVFSSGVMPSWAVGEFWAPEIHAVDGGFVAYFNAQDSVGRLVLGAAKSLSPTGPFIDIGAPLLGSSSVDFIDPHSFLASDGRRYLVWATYDQPVTVIFGREVGPDGLTLIGQTELLTIGGVDWDGGRIDAPWVVERNGTFTLFHSGNAFDSANYALGYAQSSNPLGPYARVSAPIVVSAGDFAGPGSPSVVVGPSGDDVLVYQAWRAGNVGGEPGRLTLVDRIQWSDAGVPSVFGAPSKRWLPSP